MQLLHLQALLTTMASMPPKAKMPHHAAEQSAPAEYVGLGAGLVRQVGHEESSNHSAGKHLARNGSHIICQQSSHVWAQWQVPVKSSYWASVHAQYSVMHISPLLRICLHVFVRHTVVHQFSTSSEPKRQVDSALQQCGVH